jgi:hypothetical protein
MGDHNDRNSKGASSTTAADALMASWMPTRPRPCRAVRNALGMLTVLSASRTKGVQDARLPMLQPLASELARVHPPCSTPEHLTFTR